MLVGAGILLSRLLGLVRERVFAHYLGNGVAAGAFKAALRIPNVLQNLLGEGVLSASFIPVYAGLLGKDDKEAADRVAGAVFGLLALVTGALVAAGLLAAPLLTDLVAPGFEGEARALCIRLVRTLFPATGLLVMSAWCLGVLNSHRRFFLSYAAPAAWNLALIATLLWFGGKRDEAGLAEALAWGTVAGSFLQFALQVPNVRALLGAFRPSLGLGDSNVRQVVSSFGPVVVGRGVVQVSAYVDVAWASLLGPRAVSALAYAQAIYLLPVSLFGMAVSAAELPEMAREAGSAEEVAAALKGRMEAALGRMAFFVVPSAAAFLMLGDVVAAALLQTGRFDAAESRYAWYLLAGSAVGLLASTQGRLYASAFYALKDTRTPLAFSVARVGLGAALAWWSALHLPGLLGLPAHLGGVGITLASGLAAWVEYTLLRRALARRTGEVGIARSRLVRLWGCALVAGAAGLAVKAGLAAWRGVDAAAARELGGSFLQPPATHPWLTAAAVLGIFGGVYLLTALAAGVPEASAVIRRVSRRRG